METADFDGMYTGCDYDAETGLTYHWNRWRSEDGSSFVSEDPIRDGANWYGYAGCNPLVYTDPTGLAPYINGIYDGPYNPDYNPGTPEIGPPPNPNGIPQNQSPNITGRGPSGMPEGVSPNLSQTNSNLYHYAGNNPVWYVDPTGMWTDNEDGTSTAVAGDTVGKSNSPTILSISGGANGATSKSQNSPTYYFNQNNGSQYYDNNGNLVLVGTALPNPWETMGDALSSASFFLNCANLGCTFTGQFAAAEGCGIVAAGCDIGATFCYFVGGCNNKAVASLMGVCLDFVPTAAYYFKPSLKAGYNMAAQRFINPATGRFITNTAGYTNYLAGPTTGITYSVGLSIYSKNKE